MTSPASTWRHTTIEEYLATHGSITYTARGTSMLPLIRQGRDLFVIERKAGRLRPYDVALYRRGTAYVLHRVIGVTKHGYLIRGDNCWATERVAEHQVIGVMTTLIRNGCQLGANDWRMRTYARLWHAALPVRWIARTLVHGTRRVVRLHGA